MIHGLLIEKTDCRELIRSVSFEVALFRVLPQGGETRKPRPQAWGQVKPLPKAPTGRDSLIRARSCFRVAPRWATL